MPNDDQDYDSWRDDDQDYDTSRDDEQDYDSWRDDQQDYDDYLRDEEQDYDSWRVEEQDYEFWRAMEQAYVCCKDNSLHECENSAVQCKELETGYCTMGKEQSFGNLWNCPTSSPNNEFMFQSDSVGSTLLCFGQNKMPSRHDNRAQVTSEEITADQKQDLLFPLGVVRPIFQGLGSQLTNRRDFQCPSTIRPSLNTGRIPPNNHPLSLQFSPPPTSSVVPCVYASPTFGISPLR